MKKIINLIITGCLIFALLIPQVAFAAVGGEEAEWQDIVLSDEKFEEILSNNPDNQIMPLSSDLINRHSIAIQKNGNSLIIAGATYGSSEVSKCGFTKVSIQRRSNSGASWSNYQTYSDLYNNSHQYILSKSISVPSGYQYRVTCTHYAKKNVVSTQKINATSNILTF